MDHLSNLYGINNIKIQSTWFDVTLGSIGAAPGGYFFDVHCTVFRSFVASVVITSHPEISPSFPRNQSVGSRMLDQSLPPQWHGGFLLMLGVLGTSWIKSDGEETCCNPNNDPKKRSKCKMFKSLQNFSQSLNISSTYFHCKRCCNP